MGPIPAPFAASPPMHDKVLIVDFGSQVTQLIARRVREERVYCEIVPYQKAEAAFRDMKPKAVILSGGPASVLDKGAPLAPKAIYEAGVPVLGICYGEQAMGIMGANIIVGSRVWTCQLHFRLRMGPMNFAEYQRLLPRKEKEGGSFRRLCDWVHQY